MKKSFGEGEHRGNNVAPKGTDIYPGCFPIEYGIPLVAQQCSCEGRDPQKKGMNMEAKCPQGAGVAARGLVIGGRGGVDGEYPEMGSRQMPPYYVEGP